VGSIHGDRTQARPFAVKGERALRFAIWSSIMKSFSKWFSALVAIALLAGTAVAADVGVAAGKIKSINADKKQFDLTDSAGKDATFKIGDDLVVNRGGKESQSDLKAGDMVNILYEKALVGAWTVHYILVQEGDTKNCELVHGTFKGYDAGKKQFDLNDDFSKQLTLSLGDAKVRLNMKDSKMEDLKIGDSTLAIVERMGDKATVKALMAERK
jgi:Cu/Ag efflux protein CusF